MKPMDLFDELTYVDEAFILEVHETPAVRQTHFCFRRVGALLAAVMMVLMMTVGVVAVSTEEWNLRLFLLWEQYSFREDTGYFNRNGEVSFDIHTVSERVEQQQILCSFINVYQKDEAATYAACDSVTLEIKLDAMIMGDDGVVRYRSRTIQGDGEVTATLDNVVAGEAGTILHARSTISALDGDEWKELYQSRKYYPPEFGFAIPVGTDARFPDTRHGNYDGRAEPQSVGLTLPEDTRKEVIMDEKSNVVIVIE